MIIKEHVRLQITEILKNGNSCILKTCKNAIFWLLQTL